MGKHVQTCLQSLERLLRRGGNERAGRLRAIHAQTMRSQTRVPWNVLVWFRLEQSASAGALAARRRICWRPSDPTIAAAAEAAGAARSRRMRQAPRAGRPGPCSSRAATGPGTGRVADCAAAEGEAGSSRAAADEPQP